MVCDKDEKEDIYHFMLHGTSYNEERSHSTHLKQPYIESDVDIIGHFLFNKEDIEEKKELLFTIWTRRQHQMNTIVRFKSKIAILLFLLMVKILRRNQNKI